MLNDCTESVCHLREGKRAAEDGSLLGFCQLQRLIVRRSVEAEERKESQKKKIQPQLQSHYFPEG